MSAPALDLLDGSSDTLERAVLATLRGQVLAEVEETAEGCWLHPTGRVRWLGATFLAKRVLVAFEHGPLAGGLILTRICRSGACVFPGHHRVETRQQFGHWLGRGETWRPRPV
jgi:hypothetical protein